MNQNLILSFILFSTFLTFFSYENLSVIDPQERTVSPSHRARSGIRPPPQLFDAAGFFVSK